MSVIEFAALVQIGCDISALDFELPYAVNSGEELVIQIPPIFGYIRSEKIIPRQSSIFSGLILAMIVDMDRMIWGRPKTRRQLLRRCSLQTQTLRFRLTLIDARQSKMVILHVPFAECLSTLLFPYQGSEQSIPDEVAFGGVRADTWLVRSSQLLQCSEMPGISKRTEMAH